MIQIDIRSIPPPQRHPLIFDIFDGLQSGAAILLISDHDPKPLLFTFQHQRESLYDWSYLEEGPEAFRVRISRRAPERAGKASVSGLLGADHDRLDELFRETVVAASAGDFASARKSFAEFSVGLRRHIRAEDGLLFPVCERLIGMTGGPTAVMREEHREIEDLLTSMSAALAAGEAPTMARNLETLLQAHNMKEEHVLYPLVDRGVPEDELQRLCAGIEAC